MSKIYLLALLLIPATSIGECVEYRRIHGLIDLSKKTWEITHVNKNPTKICEALPRPPEANLELTVTKGKEKFSTTLYHSLTGFYEYPAKDKQWEGGTYPLKEMTIDSFVPSWYKGATLRITEIATKKTIVETKL